MAFYTSRTIIGAPVDGAGISPTVVLCPPFVRLLRIHSKYTVVSYELNRSLLATFYASHTIIGAPVDRSRYLTHGRVCPPYVQHLGMHPKYTVVSYELNRSLLATFYASLTIIGAPVDRSRYLTHGRVCPPYVQHLGMHPKYTVVSYELNRSLLATFYASLTIIGAPVDRSRYLTHGRVCPPYVQHLGMHPKYTVVYYELNRSLLATFYASLTIIGAPVDRSRYQVQYPRPCFAHRPDYSSVFT